MPKLSVITINYNNGSGLEKTIKSVISQTYPDFEFIIIDGGSTDDSVEIIKSYFDKITCWVSEKDTGIYNAQNKGIDLAKGEYCLFLNSGDSLVDRNVLETTFSVQNNSDIIYGDMQTVDKNQRIEHLKMPQMIGSKQLYADTLWHPVSFIKRELFSKYGKYDEQYKIVADYEFFVRVILNKKVSTKHIPIEIAVFDTSGVSADISKRSQLIEERKKIQDMYFNPVLLILFRLYTKLRN
jgi:glycosyltransferase involved in cell wall biosynthesis